MTISHFCVYTFLSLRLHCGESVPWILTFFIVLYLLWPVFLLFLNDFLLLYMHPAALSATASFSLTHCFICVPLINHCLSSSSSNPFISTPPLQVKKRAQSCPARACHTDTHTHTRSPPLPCCSISSELWLWCVGPRGGVIVRPDLLSTIWHRMGWCVCLHVWVSERGGGCPARIESFTENRSKATV